MSVLDRIKQYEEQEGNFILLAGDRFGGKTTNLGSLPGKTLLLEIADKESGSKGAIALAKDLGNHVDVVTAYDCADVIAIVTEALEMDYDNIAVDGLSALTEVESEKPDIKKQLLNSSKKWDGWREVGGRVIEVLEFLKRTARETGKTTVLTLALKVKYDAEGNVYQNDVDAKGNMAIGFIKGKCPYYVIARKTTDPDGIPLRVIQTIDADGFNARLDGFLEKDNPKGFRCEKEKVGEGEPVGLAALLNFLNGE